MGIEVTKDEADKKQFDAMEVVGKDPNYHYRWAKDREMNVARHKFHGYEVVDRKGGERSILDDGTRMKKSSDVDSSVRVGDMVLMRTKRENHEQRMKDRQNKIQRVTRSVAADYKRNVGRMAGEGIAYEEHGDNKNMKG